MRKRMVIAFGLILLCCTGMLGRLAVLSDTTLLSAAAAEQSSYILEVADTRGVIYDRNLNRLTCSEGKYIAAVMPNEQSASVLLDAADVSGRPALLKRLESLVPFTVEVDGELPYAKGLEVFWVPERYLDDQPAEHVVGLLDAATGRGASGIELAYDSLLESAGGTLQIRFLRDAWGRMVGDTPHEVIDSGYNTGAGVVLTLDLEIQRLCERAAEKIERGAVVVMDPYTGDILAMVSRPGYNPNDLASAMTDENSPFINRALYAYPVGSTFKLLSCATALEQGMSADRRYVCTGSIEFDGVVFHCHQLAGHGELDMAGALRRSCNPYFIDLAVELGGVNLLFKAQQLGFGTAAELAPGLKSQSGTLPDAKDLTAPAVVANMAMGQGELTATPIQIAVLISAMANGGGAVTPRLVMGSTSDGSTVDSQTAVYSPTPVFAQWAAEGVREMMVSVVEEGSGTNARPVALGAGGKTASAQTGRFDENGSEYVHAWFSGFYPAEDPLYTIVVLVEDGDSGSDVACPIFKEIADGLAVMHGIITEEQNPAD